MDGPGLYFLVSAMNPRDSWQEFLTSDPAICGGELCARGTQVPVTVVLDHLAGGTSREEILCRYPSLRAAHIDAALAYASELAHEKSLLRMQAAGGSEVSPS